MEKRKLNDIRKYFKQATNAEALIPEIRVLRQVVDLQLLKAAIKEQGLYEPDINGYIDTCIEGFIWYYVNGGTQATLPSILTEDAEAQEYYDRFSVAWANLQDYMRINMYLMEI